MATTSKKRARRVDSPPAVTSAPAKKTTRPKPDAKRAPRNREVDAALVNAACRGDHTGALQALAAGAAPNSADPTTGYTALHYAAQRGDLVLMAALLGAGANVEAALRNARSTPLCSAVTGKQHGAVEALLRAGAQPNLLHGRLEWTPLHDAVMALDGRSVELLLAGGAAPDLPSKHGLTALGQLVRMAGSFERAAVEPIVRALLASGADPVSAREQLHPALTEADPDLGYVVAMLGKRA